MDSEWLRKKRESLLHAALKCEDLIEAQRDAILGLDRKWALRGLSPASRHAYVSYAKELGRFLGKPFQDATRTDLEAYFAMCAGKNAPRSMANVKLITRIFYRALLAPDAKEFPDLVAWIRVGTRELRDRRPSELLTRDEILRLATATTNPRDRAIIMTIYDSAARAAELINLRVGDVAFDEYGARATLRGKTGERRVRLMHSVQDIQNWIENFHPRRTDPDAPMFLSWGHGNWHKPLLHDGLRKVLLAARAAAGIKKRLHPHLFRHSRLTELAKILSESELKVFAGWTADSKMARVYVHLSGEDVDRKLLQNAGLLRRQDDQAANPLATKNCLRCGKTNSATALHCVVCKIPFDEKEILGVAKEHEKLMENLPKLLKLMEDPRVKAILQPAS